MAIDGRPLRSDAERNRTRILAAAREVFAERGLEATLHDVAAHAGVGVGTVYRRYPNKDALIDELFVDRIDEIVAVAEDALAAADAWQGLVDFLDRSNAMQSRNLGLKALIVGSRRGEERVAAARERLAPVIARVVERAQEDGQLRQDLAASDIGLVQLMLSAVIDASVEVRPDIWRRALGILLDGLRASRQLPSVLTAPAFLDQEAEAAMRGPMR